MQHGETTGTTATTLQAGVKLSQFANRAVEHVAIGYRRAKHNLGMQFDPLSLR